MNGDRKSGDKPEKREERSADQPVKGSPITRRILAINVFALAVLVVGLLYEGQYRQGLINSEIAALTHIHFLMPLTACRMPLSNAVNMRTIAGTERGA